MEQTVGMRKKDGYRKGFTITITDTNPERTKRDMKLLKRILKDNNPLRKK